LLQVLHKATTPIFDNLRKRLAINIISKFICIRSFAFVSSAENVLHIFSCCRNIATFKI